VKKIDELRAKCNPSVRVLNQKVKKKNIKIKQLNAYIAVNTSEQVIELRKRNQLLKIKICRILLRKSVTIAYLKSKMFNLNKQLLEAHKSLEVHEQKEVFHIPHLMKLSTKNPMGRIPMTLV
jgi:hypothetical protein